ncbi:hypothetical protein TNCV_3271711 [Trichonephila clavipes]|nr:hypothetical protein TNCV_3271711 [Trichonephila clavipes]
MEVNKEKLGIFYSFVFDKGENASQGAEIVNGVYGVDTVKLITCKFDFVDSVQAFLMLKLPETNQKLNSGIYWQQMDCFKLVTDQKRPELTNRRGVVFPLDNARPHTSVLTHQKLWELD